MTSFLALAQSRSSSPQRRPAIADNSRAHSYPIHRKIHPDLSSLLDERPSDQHKELEEIYKPTVHSLHTSRPEFTSLTPGTRKQVSTMQIQDGSITQGTSRQLNQSVSSSNDSSTTGKDLSGDTFGQQKSANKTTPSSHRSQQTEDESQRVSNRTTPQSASEAEQSEQSRRTEGSGNTFGTPSPRLGALQRRPRVSIETQPPMPPLEHPAFLLTSVRKQVNAFLEERDFVSSSNEKRRLNVTHSHSLPTLTRQGRLLPKRRRARTQSRIAPLDFFLEAKSSTPASHVRKRHKRSQSNASKSSGRRASVEFSAERASLASLKSDSSTTWEAQVSREMVRLSLSDEPRRPEKLLAAASKYGQARGDHLVGVPSLGPPFLLQNSHTHSIPPKTHYYNTPYTFTFGNDCQGFERSTMSRSASHKSPPAKSKTSERARPPSPKPKIKTASSLSSGVTSASHLVPPALSLTTATPDASPITPISPPTLQKSARPRESVLPVPETPSPEKSASAKNGKRKADEADVEGGGTPPKETKEPRATFAADPRPHRISGNSNSTRSAPSSYHRKRARLSTTAESRPGSRQSSDIQNAATIGSWSSSKNNGFSNAQHHNSRAPSSSIHQPPPRPPSRQSLSQASIPMSALISPHAPSVARSSLYHMRDPHKPSPVHSTPWSLSFPSGQAGENEGWRGWMNRGGSPPHAWLFFLGFVIFPLWWVASFWRVPTTRRLDAGEQEKGVILDDPQVEHDAKSWRMRCRVMSVVSFLTYIPFIVLVAIFA